MVDPASISKTEKKDLFQLGSSLEHSKNRKECERIAACEKKESETKYDSLCARMQLARARWLVSFLWLAFTFVLNNGGELRQKIYVRIEMGLGKSTSLQYCTTFCRFRISLM